jgi:hypothetical protein
LALMFLILTTLTLPRLRAARVVADSTFFFSRASYLDFFSTTFSSALNFRSSSFLRLSASRLLPCFFFKVLPALYRVGL